MHGHKCHWPVTIIVFVFCLQPMNKRIDLFCVLETLKVVDQSITTIFMDAAMESLHQMVCVDSK